MSCISAPTSPLQWGNKRWYHKQLIQLMDTLTWLHSPPHSKITIFSVQHHYCHWLTQTYITGCLSEFPSYVLSAAGDMEDGRLTTYSFQNSQHARYVVRHCISRTKCNGLISAYATAKNMAPFLAHRNAVDEIRLPHSTSLPRGRAITLFKQFNQRLTAPLFPQLSCFDSKSFAGSCVSSLVIVLRKGRWIQWIQRLKVLALSNTETGSWETQCSQMLPHDQDYPVSNVNHAASAYHCKRGCPKCVC